MPEYNWTCLACDYGNDKKNERCEVCGCPAEARLENVEASKYLINCGRVKCEKCGMFLNYNFSEDFYNYRKRGAFFRILYIDIGCSCNSNKERNEYFIPFFRKIYRKHYEENGERWFFNL